ncbi:MAG: elongation factor P [Candidatus Liptonbacteria bacterium]|nr:elongation factor P [Candidatus Liptonbacteria bacterium]
MLSYTELKKGTIFAMNGEPYEVLESGFLRMQQRKAVMQTKLRNLISGKVLDRNFQSSEQFEEAEVEKKPAVFIYQSKGVFWFHEEGKPQNRYSLGAEVLGDSAQFLLPNLKISTVLFNGKIIKVLLPIKLDLKVADAPPAVKGNTAQGGTKIVELEGGANISAPLFINTGDIVRVNTETGEYVERVEKA